MSRVVLIVGQLVVSAHAGPASEGADRRRWQIMAIDQDGVDHTAATINYRELEELTLALVGELARDWKGSDT